MDLDKAIQNRHSVRKYKEDLVTLKQISLLLDAAAHSPSSGNLQDTRFIVVNNKEKNNKIAEASLGQYWMNTAPVFIVICSDISRLKTYFKDRAENYSLQNSAASAMLISLKAVDLGLATCWVNVFDQNAVSRVLNIRDSTLPQIILTIGYESEKPLKKLSHIPLKRIVSFNKHGDRVINEKEWSKERYFDKLKKLLSK